MKIFRTILNSVFPNYTPGTKGIHQATTRSYNREQRRNDAFVVQIGDGYVRMKQAKPFKYDLEYFPKKASKFTYKNALRVCDETIAKNPVIWRIDKFKGKIRLT